MEATLAAVQFLGNITPLGGKEKTAKRTEERVRREAFDSLAT